MLSGLPESNFGRKLLRHRHLHVSRRALALLLLLPGACSRPEVVKPVRTTAPRAEPTPALHDVGRDCADVMTLRACWTADGRVVGVPRPADPVFSRGARCWGMGDERKCEDRAWESDAFRCNAAQCSQKMPRLPDDGEWECADLDGVVVCHGGHVAAGVIQGTPDVGWRCGMRRGFDGDRVCVDLSPDRPDGEPWSCRFHYEPAAARRSCQHGGPGPLGHACASGCPFGTACSENHCLPLEPHPDCWIDRDCGAGNKCAYGTCRPEAK